MKTIFKVLGVSILLFGAACAVLIFQGHRLKQDLQTL